MDWSRRRESGGGGGGDLFLQIQNCGEFVFILKKAGEVTSQREAYIYIFFRGAPLSFDCKLQNEIE